MSANNRRIRRVIVDILWEHGAMTKQEVAEHLQNHRGVRQVPSPQSLSALLSKNPQVICVGIAKVETAAGITARHMTFGIELNTRRGRLDAHTTGQCNDTCTTQGSGEVWGLRSHQIDAERGATVPPLSSAVRFIGSPLSLHLEGD